MRRIYLWTIGVLMVAALCACVSEPSCADKKQRAEEAIQVATICTNTPACSIDMDDIARVRRLVQQAEACK